MHSRPPLLDSPASHKRGRQSSGDSVVSSGEEAIHQQRVVSLSPRHPDRRIAAAATHRKYDYVNEAGVVVRPADTVWSENKQRGYWCSNIISHITREPVWRVTKQGRACYVNQMTDRNEGIYDEFNIIVESRGVGQANNSIVANKNGDPYLYQLSFGRDGEIKYYTLSSVDRLVRPPCVAFNFRPPTVAFNFRPSSSSNMADINDHDDEKGAPLSTSMRHNNSMPPVLPMQHRLASQQSFAPLVPTRSQQSFIPPASVIPLLRQPLPPPPPPARLVAPSPVGFFLSRIPAPLIPPPQFGYSHASLYTNASATTREPALPQSPDASPVAPIPSYSHHNTDVPAAAAQPTLMSCTLPVMPPPPVSLITSTDGIADRLRLELININTNDAAQRRQQSAIALMRSMAAMQQILTSVNQQS